MTTTEMKAKLLDAVKGKPTKLPVPPPKTTKPVTAPKPAALDDVPDFLDAKANGSVPRGFKDEKALAIAKTAREATKALDDSSAKIKEALKASKRTKSQVRIEKLKATKSGERAKMPLTGKTAVAAIKGKPAKAAGKVKGAKKPDEASALAPKAKKAPSGAPKAGKRSSYDWEAAEAAAKSGKLPTLPPFGSYAPHLKEVYDFAKKRDIKGVKAVVDRLQINTKNSGQMKLVRFRDLCLLALK